MQLYHSLILVFTVIKFSSGNVPLSYFEEKWWETIAKRSNAVEIDPEPATTWPSTTTRTTTRPWTTTSRSWTTTKWTPWTSTSRPSTPSTPTTWYPYNTTTTSYPTPRPTWYPDNTTTSSHPTPTTPRPTWYPDNTTTSSHPTPTTPRPTPRPTWYPDNTTTSSHPTPTTPRPTTPRPTTPRPTTPRPTTPRPTTPRPTTRPTWYPDNTTTASTTTPTTPTTRTPYTTTSTPPFTSPSPQPFTLPPYQNTARMARFVVHFSNWGSLSYQAQQSEIDGYPSVRVYSISDGYLYAGTGVPYFMVSPLDLTVQALDTNERCSLIVSLSQTSYCDAQSWDPEDPRCVQVILTGRFVKLPNNSDEMRFARRVLWDRHPQMISWFVNKTDHHWEFAKLNIEFITVIDYFGGRKYPGLSDYFSAESPKSYTVELA